nr:hypothetical protein [Tanacetum cinerariifolium]
MSTFKTYRQSLTDAEWLKYVTQVRLTKRLTVDKFDDLFYYLQQFEKVFNTSRAKKLEKSHDSLALVAHMGSSSQNTSSYYVTHPTSMVNYDDEYQQDDIQTNPEDPLASAMMLLARAITQNFSNPTNNRLRTSSNTRNQAIIQGDRVNIQSMNSGNTRRNNRRAYVQEEVVERSNEIKNVQRNLRTSSSGNTSTVQCYNCSGKGHYSRNCPKPRVWDSKYFMEQMLLAKKDEVGVIITDEQNDFLYADASRLEEIEDLNFVPQKELSAEQKYFPSSFIPSDKTSNATTFIPSSMPNFQVQSLIKECDNVKMEYQKLFNSIKKTRSQTQKKIDELIAHVSEKTYACGAIRAENQNLLFIISELKTRLKNVEK